MSEIYDSYKQFRSAGLTDAAIFGMLGNFAAESGNLAYRVEGDVKYPYTKSRDYTRSVDSGAVSEDAFCQPFGFGLAQWTWPPRKHWLWAFWKSWGGSVGDRSMQVSYAIWELQNKFPDLYALLCRTDDVYQATDKICEEYENPAYRNTDDRYRYALQIRDQIKQEKAEEDAEPTPPVEPVEKQWPPRMIDKSMEGSDVAAAQALLKARGYYSGEISGKFDDATEAAAEAFQMAKGLAVDGVIGPRTWAKLTELTA